MIEQTSEQQALARDQREAIQKSTMPVLFAKPDSNLLPFSNWDKAKLFDVVDFSPAVKAGTGVGGRRNETRKPVLYLACDANPTSNPRTGTWSI